MNGPQGSAGGWKLVAAFAGGLLVAGVVGVFVWFASGTPAAPFGGAVLHGGLRNVWEQSIAPMPPPVSVVLEQPLKDIPQAASAPLPRGQVEVCGLGVVSGIDFNRRVRQQVAAEEDAEARRKVVTALLADSDDLSRAVALVLQSSGGPVVPDESVACEGPACPEVPEKVESAAARTRRIAANTAPRDKLARLAMASRSPELYGLAWQVCRSQGQHDEPSACQLMSSDQWARLEPHDTTPWFEVANQARRRGDRAAVAEALYRVSQATTSHARVGQLNARLLSRLPQGVTLLNAMALGTEMAAIERSWSPVTATVLDDHCSASAMRDANRHQRCDAIAGVMVKHGTAAADVLEGLRVGERAGWPAAKVAGLRAEVESLQQASEALRPEGSLSCASVARYLKHLKDVGEHGELAAARRLRDGPDATTADAARDKPAVQARAEAAARAAPLSR